jgi:outer membrane protein OmpA-like peptidoglycan-associated protein
MYRAITGILFLHAFCGLLSAQQNPVAVQKQADKLYDRGRWKEAVELYNQYQASKPGNPDVLTRLGISYYHLHQPEQAQRLLEFVKSQNPATKDVDVLYFLARTLHGRSEFEKAIPAYKAFLAAAPPEHPSRNFCVDNILRCAKALQIPANEAVALVENMGNILNTEGDEFAPVPSVNHPDRLYYTAARPGCTGGRRDERGYEDEEKGEWRSDMFIAKQTNSGWEDAGSFGGLFNTARSETTLDFSENGNILYFSRGFTLFSGEMLADTSGKKDEYSDTPPKFKGPVQMEEGDASPFFFNDSTVLFASRRPGGFGGADLYYSVQRNGIWSLPQNLGAVINSPYDETTPFLAADGSTLYFSANHNRTIGGMDVFKAIFNKEKRSWSEPQNMGVPVNSPGDDAFFRLAADGNTAYFSSDRLDNYGRRDLLVAYFKEQQMEQATTGSPWMQTILPEAVANQGSAAPTAPVQTALLPVLPYTNDRDVLAAPNLLLLDTVAMTARNAPRALVQITVHTDETGAAKFDLYYGIKRAELVGKALTERGIPASRILLKSGGSQYPLARTVRAGAPDPEGNRLNRRVEIRMTEAGSTPVVALPQRPLVSREQALDGGPRYDRRDAGLSYKVEAVVTRQLLNNDALAMFGEIVIESQQGSGAYRYLAGNFAKYADAARTLKELQAQDFNTAIVVAYIDGWRISKAEAVTWLKKYPDLAAYIKG